MLRRASFVAALFRPARRLNWHMRRGPVITLGLAVLFVSGLCASAGDDPPLAYLNLDQRLNYSDLVCSATIIDTWRTGGKLAVDSSVTAENLARADVQSVFKGKLTSATITFRWFSWPGPMDPIAGPSGYVYAGPPLADLRNERRYLLFLRSDGSTGWSVTVPMYQLEVPLAASAPANLRLGLDASGLAIAQRNRELAEEFAAAVQSQVDLAHVYNNFSWIAELLGKGATPLIQPFLESATPLLRYFAADRLAQMNDAAGENVLLAILNDQSQESWMRANAAWDVGKLHSARVLPDLAKVATDDPEAAVREGALRGLAELADPSSEAVLVRALDDRVEENRVSAAAILEKIIYGNNYSVDIVKAHEEEIIAAWKAWWDGSAGAPDYTSYLPP
ncbi:MAG: hypothetical protein DMG39_10125 [Acidobacteria bacterium]|nr:MAG: hypothetical protein DMG39_10125 [Acidobacteriota bacterium]